MKPVDLKHAVQAAELVVEVHRRLVIGPSAILRAGVTLAEVDRFVARTLEDLGTRSAFLGYKAPRYPAFPSFACLSVNDVVVHGTAGMTLKPLKPGDLISIDIGVIHRGWIGDAAWTYIIGGDPSPDLLRLCECGVEALRRGIPTLRPGNPLREWAAAVQKCVEQDYGYFCVTGLGGHRYGRSLHEPPHVANLVSDYPEQWPDANFIIEADMLLAVEPIIAVGTRQVTQRPRQWPIRTADGSLSVHYEHDVYITPEGPRVLTAGLEDLPIVVGA